MTNKGKEATPKGLWYGPIGEANTSMLTINAANIKIKKNSELIISYMYDGTKLIKRENTKLIKRENTTVIKIE